MTKPHATIRPQPGVLDIQLYKGGEARLPGVSQPLKLSSNENPLGPSPAALAAFKHSALALERYPDSSHLSLRTAIGEVHGLDPERIVCGAGSDEVITFLCQVYAGPGDEVVYTEHGFGMYRISALAAGATPVEARESNRQTDVDALLGVCNERTKLVFVANPNNPTGTMISASQIARLSASLPPQALLVLDGAYAEYVDGYDGGAALVDSRDNVVMTRTFSKIYGLGGMRVGWGYGPEHVVDALNRVRGPFNLSTPALATAEAAVRDTGWVEKCRMENSANRVQLTADLSACGIACDETFANFVLARFSRESEASACDLALRDRGIIVRRVASYKLPECLRITIGTAADCGFVAETCGDFMKARA